MKVITEERLREIKDSDTYPEYLLENLIYNELQELDTLTVTRLMPMRECKQDRTVLVDTDFSEDLTEAAVDTANQVIITSSGHEIKFSDCTGWIPVPRYEPGD